LKGRRYLTSNGGIKDDKEVEAVFESMPSSSTSVVVVASED